MWHDRDEFLYHDIGEPSDSVWVQSSIVVIVVALLLYFWFTISSPAAELSMCSSPDNIEAELAKSGEIVLVTWREKDDTMRAFFANPDTEAWTLVVIDEAGYACTMRNGVGMITRDQIIGQGA